MAPISACCSSFNKLLKRSTEPKWAASIRNYSYYLDRHRCSMTFWQVDMLYISVQYKVTNHMSALQWLRSSSHKNCSRDSIRHRLNWYKRVNLLILYYKRKMSAIRTGREVCGWWREKESWWCERKHQQRTHFNSHTLLFLWLYSTVCITSLFLHNSLAHCVRNLQCWNCLNEKQTFTMISLQCNIVHYCSSEL